MKFAVPAALAFAPVLAAVAGPGAREVAAMGLERVVISANRVFAEK